MASEAARRGLLTIALIAMTLSVTANVTAKTRRVVIRLQKRFLRHAHSRSCCFRFEVTRSQYLPQAIVYAAERALPPSCLRNFNFSALHSENRCNAQDIDEGNSTVARAVNPAFVPIVIPVINPFGCGHDYYFVRLSRNWYDAEKYCISSYGAHLVKVNSQHEQNFLVNFIASSSLLNTTNYWIGGHKVPSPTLWRWSCDNSPFGYSSWLPTQPDGDGTCAHMWLQFLPRWSWNDVPCTWTSVWNRPLYFICEKCGTASC